MRREKEMGKTFRDDTYTIAASTFNAWRQQQSGPNTAIYGIVAAVQAWKSKSSNLVSFYRAKNGWRKNRKSTQKVYIWEFFLYKCVCFMHMVYLESILCEIRS